MLIGIPTTSGFSCWFILVPHLRRRLLSVHLNQTWITSLISTPGVYSSMSYLWYPSTQESARVWNYLNYRDISFQLLTKFGHEKSVIWHKIWPWKITISCQIKFKIHRSQHRFSWLIGLCQKQFMYFLTDFDKTWYTSSNVFSKVFLWLGSIVCWVMCPWT